MPDLKFEIRNLKIEEIVEEARGRAVEMDELYVEVLSMLVHFDGDLRQSSGQAQGRGPGVAPDISFVGLSHKLNLADDG